jgi:hypothetical protein
MQVTYKNFVFDTDRLRAFPTGNESMPTVYVAESGLCFIETMRKRWETSRIRHLQFHEAIRYAETFKVDELKTYLLACRCAGPTDTPAD